MEAATEDQQDALSKNTDARVFHSRGTNAIRVGVVSRSMAVVRPALVRATLVTNLFLDRRGLMSVTVGRTATRKLSVLGIPPRRTTLGSHFIDATIVSRMLFKDVAISVARAVTVDTTRDTLG